MCRTQRKLVAAAEVAGTVALSLTLMLGVAWAGEKTYVMRISVPTINDPPHQLAKNFAAAVERYAAILEKLGRYKDAERHKKLALAVRSMKKPAAAPALRRGCTVRHFSCTSRPPSFREDHYAISQISRERKFASTRLTSSPWRSDG